MLGSARGGEVTKVIWHARILNIEFMKTFTMSKLGYAFVPYALPSALM